GAAVVTFDMIFSETDRTNPSRVAQDLAQSDSAEAKAMAGMLANLPDHDEAFAAALAKTQAVLGFAVSRESNAARPPVKSGLAFVGVEPTRVLPAFRGSITSLPV